MQLENKNVNNNPTPFASYIARYRTPYQQSKSTTPLYYSWNLGGEFLCHFSEQIRPQSPLNYHMVVFDCGDSTNGSFKACLCAQKQRPCYLAAPRWLTEQSLPAGVHFIMIGAYELQPQPAPYTSTNMLISATQIAWITADLAAVDRSVTPWIVAMFHPREPLLQKPKSSWFAHQAVICIMLPCSVALTTDASDVLVEAGKAWCAPELREPIRLASCGRCRGPDALACLQHGTTPGPRTSRRSSASSSRWSRSCTSTVWTWCTQDTPTPTR